MRTPGEVESSKRIHGHTYHAEVTLRGEPDRETGMVMDLGFVRRVASQTHVRRVPHSSAGSQLEDGVPPLPASVIVVGQMQCLEEREEVRHQRRGGEMLAFEPALRR